MLRLSTKARYGLRAMIELATHEGQQMVQLSRIAEGQRLSTKYLEQLVIPLRNAGLLRSTRGPRGGYVLARPSSEITALDVVEAIEGPLDLVDCVGQPDLCEWHERCAARDLWRNASAAVKAVLAGASLETLAREQAAVSESGCAARAHSPDGQPSDRDAAAVPTGS